MTKSPKRSQNKPTTPAARNDHVLQLLQNGFQRHQSGQLKDAANIYRQIIDVDPDHPDANFLLGSLLLQTGDPAQAAELLSRAIAATPDQPMYHSTMGSALFQLGRIDEAANSFRKAIAVDANFFDAHNSLGNALSAMGRREEAIASYRAAIAIKPDFPEAYCNLGLALHGLGQLEGATESYRQAITLRPKFTQAHNNLGISYKELGQMDEAVACFQQAIALNPDYADAHNNLGAVFESMERIDDAIDCYTRATILRPNFANAHFNLADVLRMQGQLDDAAAGYDRVLALVPDHADARSRLGDVRRSQGRLDEAISCYKTEDTSHSRSKALECLFALQKEDEFYQYENNVMADDDINLRIASISAYAAHQFGRPDPYRFCAAPLDFVRVRSLYERGGEIGTLLENVANELQEVEAAWEPSGRTTHLGFQSENIFDSPTGALAGLEAVIKSEISAFHRENTSADCLCIRRWPEELVIKGWFVRLMKGGHQSSHTHPQGWLSGVVYLKIPDTATRDEGAIEFSLHGNDYPVFNEDIPVKRHHPEVGQIVMFPSSLHHRTIPFDTEDERVCIAYDLMPPE